MKTGYNCIRSHRSKLKLGSQAILPKLVSKSLSHFLTVFQHIDNTGNELKGGSFDFIIFKAIDVIDLTVLRNKCQKPFSTLCCINQIIPQKPVSFLHPSLDISFLHPSLSSLFPLAFLSSVCTHKGEFSSDSSFEGFFLRLSAIMS